MLTQFQVKNFKALKDVTLDLTPIHVLIGPNDSGKTSVLEALAALSRSTEMPLAEAFPGNWEGRSLQWRQDPSNDVTFRAAFEGGLTYELACKFAADGRGAFVANEIGANAPFPLSDTPFTYVQFSLRGQRSDPRLTPIAESIYEALHGLHYCRWNSRFLSLPAAPDSRRRFRMDESGFGLALCLDDILGYDREAFGRLEQRFREIFPRIASIKLIAQPAYRSPPNASVPTLEKADGKGICFEPTGGGKLISAAQASDGVLLVLAYLALLYLPEPPRFVLIEEPENGIHPKRLEDVLKILRGLIGEQGHTQVVLTTHSPYVVDLFAPEEVSLCRKEADGSVSISRLSASKKVREQLDVFSLGEIWTAEGDDAISRPDEQTEELAR